MKFSDYVIFVDESGDQNIKTVNPQYPVFVLVFCIFQKADYANSIVPKVEKFKFNHFGHDAVVLHERKLRKQEKPFVFLQNFDKRTAFMNELSCLINDVKFTIVATAIEKFKLLETYIKPANPYELAIKYCLERAYEFLRDRQQHDHITHIVVERRGTKEDNELELAFRRICDGSNIFRTKFNFEIVFADKKINSTGLQLADLTARPIGLKVIRPAQENRTWNIIERKLRKNFEGGIKGWGLQVFPE